MFTLRPEDTDPTKIWSLKDLLPLVSEKDVRELESHKLDWLKLFHAMNQNFLLWEVSEYPYSHDEFFNLEKSSDYKDLTLFHKITYSPGKHIEVLVSKYVWYKKLIELGAVHIHHKLNELNVPDEKIKVKFESFNPKKILEQLYSDDISEFIFLPIYSFATRTPLSLSLKINVNKKEELESLFEPIEKSEILFNITKKKNPLIQDLTREEGLFTSNYEEGDLILYNHNGKPSRGLLYFVIEPGREGLLAANDCIKERISITTFTNRNSYGLKNKTFKSKLDLGNKPYNETHYLVLINNEKKESEFESFKVLNKKDIIGGFKTSNVLNSSILKNQSYAAFFGARIVPDILGEVEETSNTCYDSKSKLIYLNIENALNTATNMFVDEGLPPKQSFNFLLAHKVGYSQHLERDSDSELKRIVDVTNSLSNEFYYLCHSINEKELDTEDFDKLDSTFKDLIKSLKSHQKINLEREVMAYNLSKPYIEEKHIQHYNIFNQTNYLNHFRNNLIKYIFLWNRYYEFQVDKQKYQLNGTVSFVNNFEKYLN